MVNLYTKNMRLWILTTYITYNKILIDSMLIMAYIDNDYIMWWTKGTYLGFITWYIICDILIISIIMESALCLCTVFWSVWMASVLEEKRDVLLNVNIICYNWPPFWNKKYGYISP